MKLPTSNVHTTESTIGRNVQYIKCGLVGFLRVTTLLCLVLHFALTILYVGPVNPIKMKLQSVLDATIGTYFPQDWTFFAPEPVDTNFFILVQPLTSVQQSAAIKTGLLQNGWRNITAPGYARLHQNRFSAYDRLMRPQYNTATSLLNVQRNLVPWIEGCKSGDRSACKLVQENLKKSFPPTRQTLVNIASAYCNATQLSRDNTYVAIQIRQVSSVPWSQRFTGKPVVKDINVGIFPINRHVAPCRLYATRELL